MSKINDIKTVAVNINSQLKKTIEDKIYCIDTIRLGSEITYLIDRFIAMNDL